MNVSEEIMKDFLFQLKNQYIVKKFFINKKNFVDIFFTMKKVSKNF